MAVIAFSQNGTPPRAPLGPALQVSSLLHARDRVLVAAGPLSLLRGLQMERRRRTTALRAAKARHSWQCRIKRWGSGGSSWDSLVGAVGLGSRLESARGSARSCRRSEAGGNPASYGHSSAGSGGLIYCHALYSEFEPEKNIIYLTVSIPELDPSYKLEVTSNKLTFSGHSTPPAATATASAVEPKTYEFELDLFGEVEEVKRTLTGKNLSLILRKKEASEDYWPRLTKEKVKLNFLKVRPAFLLDQHAHRATLLTCARRVRSQTDFSKWKDQDEQEDEEPAEEAPPQGVRALASVQSLSRVLTTLASDCAAPRRWYGRHGRWRSWWYGWHGESPAGHAHERFN